MSHTPGPWTVGGDGKGEFVTDCIMGPNGEEVFCLGAHDYDQYGYIASPADVALIAAVPDLLAALLDLAPGLHSELCTGCDWRTCDAWQHKAANEAIAKATEPVKEPA